MISLIMLSWSRMTNVKLLTKHYETIGLINDLLVFNNNIKFNLSSLVKLGDTIKVIQSTTDLGLYTRYSTAALADHECILFVDDDLVVPEDTIQCLYNEWQKNRYCCHGIIGRSIKGGYSTQNFYGDVKIVLTRCSMTHRDNCIDALKYTKHFDHLNPIPKGNGEDIILSYTAMINSGQLNKVYRLPYQDMEGHRSKGNKGEAIHQRFPNHYKHRQEVAMICEKLMLKEMMGRSMLARWIGGIRATICNNIVFLKKDHF